MKDNFLKYLIKLKENKRSGSAAKATKKYHLYEQLIFLNKIAPSEIQTSIANHSSQNSEERSEQQNPEPGIEPSTPKKSRRKHKPDNFKRELLNTLKNQKEESRHLSFFKGILPSLEKFNEQQTLHFQSRILQLITVIQYPTNVWQNTPNYGYQAGYNTSAYDRASSPSSYTQITSPMSNKSSPDF